MRRIAALLLLVPLLQAGSPARAQTIVLMPEATVDSPQVALGQVARIVSPPDGQADQLAGLVLAPAPAVGASMTLTLASLRDRLADLGVNRAVWTLQGAAACKVTRVDGPAEQIAQLQERSATLRAGLSGPLVAMPESAIPDSLAGCIRKLLTDQYQPAGGKLVLQFDAADRALLSLQRPAFRFELGIRRASDHFVDVAVAVYAADASRAVPGPEAAAESPSSAPAEQAVKSATVRVRAELSAPVVIAVKPINRGQVLAADDVQLAVRSVGLTSPVCRDLAAVIGQQAKRVFKPDEQVQASDLTPLALVRRNRLVTVWSRRGGMLVKTIGRAMADGVYGERILVRNEVSHEPFYGVVSGPDTVELDPTPVQQTRKPAPGPTARIEPPPGPPATPGAQQGNNSNPSTGELASGQAGD